MKRAVIFGAFMFAAPIFALAQTQAPATTDTTETPAVATPDSKNPTAPVPGKNSFTEDQARQRMIDAGYTSVDGLKLDDQGFWNASAEKDQAKINLVMDYQGNIVAK